MILARDEARVLRALDEHHGSISGDRARELRITREIVRRLVDKGAARVDGVTTDLELTDAGADALAAHNGDHR